MTRTPPAASLRLTAAEPETGTTPAAAMLTAASPPAAVRRIRVLFVLDNLQIGGTELNAVRTAERLDRSRFDLEAVCFRGEGPLRARYDAAGVPITALPIPGRFDPRRVARTARLAAFVRRGRFDVVHAHDRYSNVLVATWARFFSPASIIVSRRWWTEVGTLPHHVAARVAFRLADRVLVNSPALVDRVASEGVPHTRIVHVPNFVDDEAFLEPPPDFIARTRAELGLAAGDLTVGIIANLREVKNHALLLDAVARLAPHRPRLRAVLVGEGPLQTTLEAQARALGIASHVIFAGSRPQHPSFHHLFDISALTSHREGFPNVIVEAMAAGRPVVSTAVGGVIDAVIPGKTGLLVPPGDPAALAGALEELLADAGRRREMGTTARLVAREQFSAARALAHLHALYETLAGGNSQTVQLPTRK